MTFSPRSEPMTSATLAIPVFDADNHLYETKDAFTKFLPDRYKGAVDYVEVRGRTKIVIKGTISDYIPNPTFEVVAAPGAMEEYFRVGNPDGKDRRAIFGEPIRSPEAFREPAARDEADGRAGPGPVPHVPHPGQPPRGAPAGRSRGDPRRHPRPQRVDARDLELRLRGPDLRHPGHHPADHRAGHRGAGMGAGAGGQGRARPAGPGLRVPRPSVVRPARVRPLLGAGAGGRHPRGHALLRQRL